MENKNQKDTNWVYTSHFGWVKVEQESQTKEEEKLNCFDQLGDIHTGDMVKLNESTEIEFFKIHKIFENFTLKDYIPKPEEKEELEEGKIKKVKVKNNRYKLEMRGDFGIYEEGKLEKGVWLNTAFHTEDQVLEKQILVDLNEEASFIFQGLRDQEITSLNDTGYAFYIGDTQIKFVPEIKKKKEEVKKKIEKEEKKVEIEEPEMVEINHEHVQVGMEVKQETEIEMDSQPNKFDACTQTYEPFVEKTETIEPQKEFKVEKEILELLQPNSDNENLFTFNKKNQVLKVHYKTKIHELLAKIKKISSDNIDINSLVFDILVLQPTSLSLASTYSKQLTTSTPSPSISFKPSKQIFLYGFNVYGPFPSNSTSGGFSFVFKALNITSKKSSYAFVRINSGTPKAVTVYLEEPLSIAAEEFVVIQPCLNQNESDQVFGIQKGFGNEGAVYEFWNECSHCFGSDGVRFDIFNFDVVGICGLAYESLNELD